MGLSDSEETFFPDFSDIATALMIGATPGMSKSGERPLGRSED